jgi:predicted N-acyltransferase
LYLKRSHLNSMFLYEQGRMKFVQSWNAPLLPVSLVQVYSVLSSLNHESCSHSYGEYVFDHSWANAFYRYGGAYYPKLQSCVPFTPATGPRILVRNGPFHDQVFDGLCKCMQQLTGQVCVQICYWVSLWCFLHCKASMGAQMHRSFLLSFVSIQDCSSYMTSTGKISMWLQ